MAKFTTMFFGMSLLSSGLASEKTLGLEEFDSCVESWSGKPGICLRMDECRAAFDRWKNLRIRPTVCSYEGKLAVVCCESITKTNTKKRISQMKCEEYSKPVTETIYSLPLTPDADPISTTFSNCSYDKVELVVGGTNALPGQFPHMAAIGWPLEEGEDYDFLCGGTLISERFVLTAAHCTFIRTNPTSIQPTIIRLGVVDIKPNQVDGPKSVDVRIGRIMGHPDYHSPIKYNDIALLEMERPVEFNSFVRPACLWQKDDFVGINMGIVTGWGTTDLGGPRSDVLLKASLTLLSNDVCQPLLANIINRSWKEGFSTTQMCAGDLSGVHDTCQGDAGGPLQVTMEDNRCIFFVLGITSFGRSCGIVNSPGVYTRVSSFVPWIESVVWPNGV